MKHSALFALTVALTSGIAPSFAQTPSSDCLTTLSPTIQYAADHSDTFNRAMKKTIQKYRILLDQIQNNAEIGSSNRANIEIVRQDLKDLENISVVGAPLVACLKPTLSFDSNPKHQRAQSKAALKKLSQLKIGK